MGIFSKLTDIVNSNINSMLEKAQNPEKLSRLMIQEMEDTLVDIKSSIAGVLADKKKIERSLNNKNEKVAEYEEAAKLAVSKQKEELAKRIVEQTVLLEKEIEQLQERDNELAEVIDNYRYDLTRLEDKLAEARKKSQDLHKKTAAAKSHKDVEEKLYKADTSSAFKKFESYSQQLDLMQAEGDVVNMGRTKTLQDEIDDLKHEKAIQEKLEKLSK